MYLHICAGIFESPSFENAILPYIAYRFYQQIHLLHPFAGRKRATATRRVSLQARLLDDGEGGLLLAAACTCSPAGHHSHVRPVCFRFFGLVFLRIRIQR